MNSRKLFCNAGTSSSMFFNALKKVPKSKSHIVRITRTTFKMVHHALLIVDSWIALNSCNWVQRHINTYNRCLQVRRSVIRLEFVRASQLSSINNGWYTILNVVRVMRTMWDLLLGTFFNALKNTEELVPPLQNTLRLFILMMLSSLIWTLRYYVNVETNLSVYSLKCFN